MGHSIEECISFKLKLQRLIDIRSPTLKEEVSSTYTLISGPSNDKGKGPLIPLKVLYHKEEVREVANEISSYLDKRIEISHWISNVTTHGNGSKGEVSSESKRHAYNDETEGKEFEDHPANVKKLVDPNFQVAENEQLAMPKVLYQQPPPSGLHCQQSWFTPHPNQQAQGPRYQKQHRLQNNLERRNDPRHPVFMTYSQLLQPLIQNSLVVPKSLKPVPQPYPPGYNPNEKCGYHAGSEGHSTEDCDAFKAKVQQLIDKRYIGFQEGSLVVNVKLSPG
jgi:hypothetical protein